MKYFVRLVVVSIIFCLILSNISYAAEEIYFRDIPWFSSIEEVFDTIGIYDITDVELSEEEEKDLYEYLISDSSNYQYVAYDKVDWISSFGDGWIDEDNYPKQSYNGCTYRIFNNFHKGNVAGYNLSFIDLQFAYSCKEGKVKLDKESMGLISAEYVFDIDDDKCYNAYIDLLGKLSWMYGEPIVSVSKESVLNSNIEIIHNIFEGSNGANILLLVQYDKKHNSPNSGLLFIEYAKTDIYDTLDYIDRYIEKEVDPKYSDEDIDGL